jgi:large subunit ribosomal protein L5
MAKQTKDQNGGKAPAKGGKAPAKGGAKGAAPRAGEKKASMIPASHAGEGLPTPAPRLKGTYQATVRGKLMTQFGYANVMQVPTLEKIVLNVGVGEAVKQPKLLDTIVEELAVITGQRPVRRKAKKSIANFGLREGQEIGASVTLRGARMWEFLDRFISVAAPRIRDFKGFSTRSFDGRGNYTTGIKEQLIFPEINYDLVDQVHGIDITICTSAVRDDHAFALLKELGFPFRTDEKPRPARAA